MNLLSCEPLPAATARCGAADNRKAAATEITRRCTTLHERGAATSDYSQLVPKMAVTGAWGAVLERARPCNRALVQRCRFSSLSGRRSSWIWSPADLSVGSLDWQGDGESLGARGVL